MDTLLIIIIIVLIGYVVYTKFFEKKETNEVQAEPKVEMKYPYEKKNLLSKTEYAFFKCLKLFCDHNNLLFCPKVRMEDFLTVTDKQNYTKYRGYIKSRHIDFMICDANLHILCGIELDDKSHETQKAQKTDEFKNKVFEQIGIPLYRIRTTNNYQTELQEIYTKMYPEKKQNTEESAKAEK